MTTRLRLWIPFVAWTLVALAFGSVGGWGLGAAVAAVGYGLTGALRTRTLTQLAALDPEHRTPLPDDETLRHIHRQFFEAVDARAATLGELNTMRSSWDLLPASIVELDIVHRVLWANAASKTIFGIDRDSAVGEPLSMLVRESALISALQSGFANAISLESPVHPDRHIEVSGVRNGTQGWLLIAVDVTEARRVETMRRDFVGNVAHELKTPLTVIAGFNETLSSLADISEAERVEILGHMRTQTRSMQRLVEELLTLSRLESASSSAPFSAFAVRACALRATSSAKLAIPEGCRVELDIEDEAQLLGDENEIESAMLNLLVNALRHTSSEGVVRVTSRLTRQPRPELAIDVTDNGVGIPAEHLPRLTERFYRVDRGRSRQTGGTGLGLAIVKHIMIRHNGALAIESAVGKGSRFSLVFSGQRVKLS